MTTLQAKQINAYMMLNSAYWHVFRNADAALAILDARQAVAFEMDTESLLTAHALCREIEDLERAA